MCLLGCAHSSVRFVALGDVNICVLFITWNGSAGITEFGINLLNPEALRRYGRRLTDL
jgi:hypothetical protein